ncbi:MAG TPA: VOC family protein [Candidatus Diapherotrites archaeon]|uniref:VOC family protein n=1 Tax=Candidatus Iainarchaeum sp. TaxID=3101447 RepID=A0A7J4IVE0_9ARCH|nr:VOC family protein [Candidatus Diapherotrites archaeon]
MAPGKDGKRQDVPTKIFVNLPVKDLGRSVEFFTKLGFKFDPRFTDKNATCMIVGSDIFVMLLAKGFFKTFTKKEISDAAKSTEVIVALSAPGRDAVDALVDRALSAGAKISNQPTDQGWMYGRSFQDPDGHLWEIFYMDEGAIGKNAAGA